MRFCKIITAVVAALMVCGSARADVLATDTSDPLYMSVPTEILSSSSVTFSDSVLRVGQRLTYGAAERLTLGADLHYQNDFAGDQDGFSSFDIGGIYRIAMASENNAHIITDVIFGFKFGGSSHVRTPWFADSTYYAGLRFGRQWAGLTLAGTVKSSWIFDGDRGMSYIDFIPAAYFRFHADWRAGLGMDFRKSTNPHYDQEWLNTQLIRQYGRTQYIGHVDYEFESDEIQVGLRLNILF